MTTILRQKMQDDLQLRGLAIRTQEAYIRAVAQLATYYNRSPELLTQEELRSYFLHLTNEREVSLSSFKIALSGIKFLYKHTLQREWRLFEMIRPARSKKLPVVLAQEEVQQLLKHVKHPSYRVCLTLIYSCGLRLQEALKLTIHDINGKRLQVHIKQGKGGKDRYVPLPSQTYHLLRRHWATHRHPKLLFPAHEKAGGQPSPTASKPLDKSSMRMAMKKAAAEIGLNKSVSPHTLRHSYATHLLDKGVNIRHVQSYLGHKSITSTLIYVHLTTNGEHKTRQKLEELMHFADDILPSIEVGNDHAG